MIYRVLRFAVFLSFCGLLSPVFGAPAQDSGGGSGSSAGSEASATLPDYKLQPQDQIRVQVFQEEDINKQCDGISISQDSTVTLPLIGTISVKDKTVRQAEEMIRALYDKDYIVNPQVTLTVLKYAERKVNVIGSVTNQGSIEFPQERGLTIVDAIAKAGGQTRLADLKHVRLTHRNERGETETITIDVDAMMKHGGMDPVMLRPGDIVYVPERIL